MDEEARILAALAAAPFPDYVVDRRILLDVDWAGEDAVWIYVILADDAPKLTTDRAMSTRDIARRALEQTGISLQSYVRFRTRSEQAELDREEARR